MLRTDVIEVINSGRAWAFLGSGASVDAGGPTWSQLVDRVIQALGDGDRSRVVADPRFVAALGKAEFALALARVERHVGRDPLEAAVRAAVSAPLKAQSLLSQIADWPFGGYITANYDTLLERSLARLEQRGWVPVGNLESELSKISADATRVIWHVHGSVELPDRSRLVITESDYDHFYLETNPYLTQLRGVLAHRRLIFIGFGFQDPEFLRVLKQVGRLANLARPIYAFLPFDDAGRHSIDNRELLEKYNVDVIPYRVVAGSHARLAELLDTYGALVVRRSISYGRRLIKPPSYDPETTGLLIYNKLLLSRSVDVSGDVLNALLRARMLALIAHCQPLLGQQLLDDLEERARDVRRETEALSAAAAVEATARILAREGLVDIGEGSFKDANITLTITGENEVEAHTGRAELYEQQFAASILERASVLSIDEEGVRRVAAAAEAFLKDCVRRRALGVAMTTALWKSELKESDHSTSAGSSRVHELPGGTGRGIGFEQACPRRISWAKRCREGVSRVGSSSAVRRPPSWLRRGYSARAPGRDGENCVCR